MYKIKNITTTLATAENNHDNENQILNNINNNDRDTLNIINNKGNNIIIRRNINNNLDYDDFDNIGIHQRINRGIITEQMNILNVINENNNQLNHKNIIKVYEINKNNINNNIQEEENNEEIYLFDVTKKSALSKTLYKHQGEVLDILGLKNGDLASYGADHTLRIWNMKYYQNVTTINVDIKKYYIYIYPVIL